MNNERITASFKAFREAFKTGVIHCGDIPNGEDFIVHLTVDQILQAARFAWEELGGA